MPAATLRHVRTCSDCEREVETYRALSGRLRAAVARPTPAAAPAPARLAGAWPVAVATLVVAALAGGIAGWRTATGPDQVQVAASLAKQGPQLRSDDDAAIRAWCEQASGRPMPAVSLPSLSPVGARVDRLDGTRVVTVSYVTTARARVTVTWLDAMSVPWGQRGIESRNIGGEAVLAVRSPTGRAVVTGDAPQAVLWAAAAGLESPMQPAAHG